MLVLVPSQDLVPEELLRLGHAHRGDRRSGRSSAVSSCGCRRRRLAPGGRPSRRSCAAIRSPPFWRSCWSSWPASPSGARCGASLRGQTDAHVPMMVKQGAYDQVAADIDTALSQAGLELEPGPAPAVMSKPAQWLAKVAGRDAGDLVPDHLLQLHGPELDILVYPSDLLVSGKPADVARARAAIASRLVTSAAYMTISGEAQAIEDRIAAPRGRDATATADGPPPVRRRRAARARVDRRAAGDDQGPVRGMGGPLPRAAPGRARPAGPPRRRAVGPRCRGARARAARPDRGRGQGRRAGRVLGRGHRRCGGRQGHPEGARPCRRTALAARCRGDVHRRRGAPGDARRPRFERSRRRPEAVGRARPVPAAQPDQPRTPRP